MALRWKTEEFELFREKNQEEVTKVAASKEKWEGKKMKLFFH